VLLGDIDEQSTIGYVLVEVEGAFDRKMGEILIQWREFLVGRECLN